MFSKTIAMFLLLPCACDAVKGKADVVNIQMMRREDAMDTNTTLGFQAQKQRLVLDSKGGASDGAHAAHVVEASSGDELSSVALWSQLGDSNRKCTSVNEHDVDSQLACQNEALAADHEYYQYSDDPQKCSTAATCASPITGTSWPWKIYRDPVKECEDITGCPSPTVDVTCPLHPTEPVSPLYLECPCPETQCHYTWTCMQAHIQEATQEAQVACAKVFAKDATKADELCCAKVLEKCSNWQDKCYHALAYTYCFFPELLPRRSNAGWYAPPEFRDIPCADPPQDDGVLLEGNVTHHQMTMHREQEKASQQEVSLDESLSGKRTCR